MKRIVVKGTVPDSFTNQKQFYMKVAPKDLDKVHKFFKEINTNFRAGSISVAKKEIIENCRAGDYIQLTVEAVQRKSGIGIQAVDCRKLKA
jgi:hypothetical protein